MEFSHLEKRDIVECYILSNKNAVRAADEYFRHYFDRRQPSLPQFKRLYDNLGEYGSFTRPRRKRGVNEAAQVNALACVYQNPCTSTRQISSEAGPSQSTVVKTLHLHKFHPYKLNVSQTLHAGDEVLRMEYCTWFRNKCARDPQFQGKVLWTDETRFTNCGIFNRHNEHMWAQENPHHVEERRPQRKFGFNVWCGVLGSTILGPFIFENTLTGISYLNFLQNSFQDMLDDINLETRASMWFQHDGAPPHNQINVRNYLNQEYPNSWIGRNGPIAWPPRSPDLSVLDFFLWGMVKNKVYRRTYQTIDELRGSVLECFNAIDRRSIRKATNSVLKRCNVCITNNGRVFEHLLK